MNLHQELHQTTLHNTTRRHFLKNCTTGLGSIYMASQGLSAWGFQGPKRKPAVPLSTVAPHFAPKAKRVIYLHMAGAPSQLDLFDYKPELARFDGKECPKEFIAGKKFAFIQGTPKMLGPQFPFKQAGKSGQWLSDRLPMFEEVIDDVCFIKSMHTDQFNHAPAQLLMHTGSQNLGYGSIGSWLTYGLGSENQNLPGYVVLVSGGKVPSAGKSVWGSGYLPSVYQGVQCRSKGDPVLYLSNPKGINARQRRRALDALNTVNRQTYEEAGDAETLTRIAQYELAYRMQMNASDAFDIASEPDHIRSLYGAAPGQESFANNCLLARRLAERGVRYIQLFDWGWDSHGAAESEAINTGFKRKCAGIDRPITALLKDLKQRGLLEDTLVIWGGEFGRTPMRENRSGQEMRFVGRDHNPGAFTIWMAGGGVKAGHSYGETDPVGYEALIDKVSPHDFHATIMHLMGYDHKRFTYPFSGVDQRLTNITKESHVVNGVMA